MKSNQDPMNQEILCQFEKLKIWKTGFSVKCPNSTATIYINKEGKPDMLHYWIEAKRSSTCAKCEKVDKFTKLLNNPKELMKLYDNQPTLVLYDSDLIEE